MHNIVTNWTLLFQAWGYMRHLNVASAGTLTATKCETPWKDLLPLMNGQYKSPFPYVAICKSTCNSKTKVFKAWNTRLSNWDQFKSYFFLGPGSGQMCNNDTLHRTAWEPMPPMLTFPCMVQELLPCVAAQSPFVCITVHCKEGAIRDKPNKER